MAGTVKSAYLMGADPIVSAPDPAAAREFLEGLDFLVVQDVFLTEAAKAAQVVLPAAAFAEKDGTFTSFDRRVQRVRKAVEPPGEARADWQIVCSIASALGTTFPYGAPAEIMNEVAELTPAYAAVSYERLDADWGMQWMLEGAARAGKAAAPQARPVVTSEQYPCVLSLDTAIGTWEANIMCRQPGTLQRESGIVHADFAAAPPVEMHPDQMKELQARPMARVKIISATGELVAAIKPNPEVPMRVLLMPYYAREQARAVLGEPAAAAEDGAPMFAPCSVRLELA
jgi:predicted molibdopterin-dependent oxidoreductase YjgC